MRVGSMTRAKVALAAGGLVLLAAGAALWLLRGPSKLTREIAPGRDEVRENPSDANEVLAPQREFDAPREPAAVSASSAPAAPVAATSAKPERVGAAVISLSELDGRPVVGARIALGGTDKPVVIGSRGAATTDEHGIAHLESIEAGLWEVWWERAHSLDADGKPRFSADVVARAAEIEVAEGQTRYYDLIVGGPRRIELQMVFVERRSLVLNISLVRATSGEVIRRASKSAASAIEDLLKPLVFADLEPDLYQVHVSLDATGMASFWEPVDALAGDAQLGPWKLDFDDFPFGELMREQLPREKRSAGLWFDNVPDLEDAEDDRDRATIESLLELKEQLEHARRPGYRGRR